MWGSEVIFRSQKVFTKNKALDTLVSVYLCKDRVLSDIYTQLMSDYFIYILDISCKLPRPPVGDMPRK